MPRMPKYLKEEWAFFLDERGRKKYNELCRKCERSCKQRFLLSRQYFNASSAVERLQERYDRLKEKCQPFLQALEHFPKLVEVFVKKVKELFSIKEAQERKEREDRAAARKEQSKHRRGRNDWERQCRQAGHPRVASEPRALREGYHAHGGRGQKSLRSTQGNL